jgi:hypothetical protein
MKYYYEVEILVMSSNLFALEGAYILSAACIGSIGILLCLASSSANPVFKRILAKM